MSVVRVPKDCMLLIELLKMHLGFCNTCIRKENKTKTQMIEVFFFLSNYKNLLFCCSLESVHEPRPQNTSWCRVVKIIIV